MSDLRARLADALRTHYLWDECNDATNHIARCRCDVDNPSITNSVPDGGWMPFDDYATHVVDVLLSLPDIAIVELPERKDNGEWSCGCDGRHVWLDHSGLYVRTLGETFVHNPRGFAAALLAAANTAEHPQTDRTTT